MKKILSVIAVAVMFSACEDQLDQSPIVQQSSGNFYSNTEQFEQAVNGVYNALNYYSTAHFYLSEVRSDNVYSPGSGVRDWNPLNNFENTLVTNNLMESSWSGPYRGVYLANVVLDKINENAVPEQADRDRITGEAQFLRALFYFDLVRFYGRVPIFDHAVTPEEALSIGRSPVADVYELIEADLKSAASLLPQSASVFGKATSGAAKALLAKVYLTMSGPTYDIAGPGLGANRYSEALTLLNEVIGSGEYSWESDYASIFSYSNENNGDMIFSVQNIDDGATGDRGIGTVLPTLMYHETWAKINLPFAGGVPADGHITPSPSFLASFDAADVRDDVAVLMSFVDENGNTNTDPQYMKFLSLDNVPADRFNWGIDFPVIRYTDVLLMKAEALIQTGGSQSDIDDIINDVRERAGLARDVSGAGLDELLAERQKEFIAEGHRWHDLVRTGKVLEVMNAWEKVDDSSDKISGIDAEDIIYPIHQSQLDVKEGLYD